MLKSGGHPSFNHMGGLLLLPMKVHINELFMANILSFAEVANITGVYIKMETSKGQTINVHIEYGKIIHFKACAERLFYTNLNDSTMVTNTTNVSLNAYSYLYIWFKNSEFLLILKLNERRKFESYSNICIGR